MYSQGGYFLSIIKLRLKTLSSPKCWSQAVMYASTPRMYPRRRCFLVRTNSLLPILATLLIFFAVSSLKNYTSQRSVCELAPHSSFEWKKLSSNSKWDFEAIFNTTKLYGLCPGQNFVYSSLVFSVNPN